MKNIFLVGNQITSANRYSYSPIPDVIYFIVVSEV